MPMKPWPVVRMRAALEDELDVVPVIEGVLDLGRALGVRRRACALIIASEKTTPQPNVS